MPDYTAGISKSWDTAIQAIQNGWVVISDNGNSSTSCYLLEISTDGTTWVRIATMFANTSTSGATIIPITKGIYYKASGGINDSVRKLTFYPCKGEVI